MASILIVGFGNIGRHIAMEFESIGADIYDPNIDEFSAIPSNKLYDFAFICAPTDALPDGSCDTSIVEKCIRQIDADIFVIKSTIPPGTTEALSKSVGKKIVFSPETYGVTQHCEKSPDFLILGGNKAECDAVANLYFKVKNGSFKIHFTDSTTAELSKYMLNTFLAMKVTFCNEFADIATQLGLSYSELRELFVADSRVGKSHTIVYPEQPYYNSHCFNKDIPAILRYSETIGVSMPTIWTMNDINTARKAKE